jgi:branched-chain amino acid transport system ATP-binding protein
LCAGYEKLVVARDIELSLEPGEILAVLGPNGAGKTTLLLTLAGFLPPIRGSILLSGQVVRARSARRMNASGVVLVPDSRALFTELTVQENLEIACPRGAVTAREMLELFPQLAERLKLRAGMLSGGEQQMLAIARALVQGPTVLLIDELSMGLAPVIVESLMSTMRDIADTRGTAIVLVEQHVGLALEVADSAMVLMHGELTLQGAAADLLKDSAALEDAYLGATTRSRG